MEKKIHIPKTIHYIWFGRGKKSELINKCISNNRQVLSDWNFIEWNEDNYDVNSCTYMQEAYDAQKYAFASDYARLDILYRYGGVYLDTDVELLKSFPDEFFKNTGFTGVESNNKINPGLVFACMPGNEIVKEILDEYKKDKFILNNGKYNLKTVVDRVTEVFEKRGFKLTGEKQIFDDFVIYPCEVFCAYDFVTNEFEITDKTVSIHHYTATWTSKRSKLKKKVQHVIRKLFGKKVYLKLIKFKRVIFEESK